MLIMIVDLRCNTTTTVAAAAAATTTTTTNNNNNNNNNNNKTPKTFGNINTTRRWSDGEMS